MEHGHFDDIARSTVDGATRRGLLRLLAGGALGAMTTRFGGAEEAAAKKKRKKKGARCMSVRQACAGGRCCGSLTCGDNGCAGNAVCYQNEGGACSGDCDCASDLLCSERKGDTCQNCSYPETPCTFTAECCLKDSICGYNGCVAEATCCQWEIGSICYDDCDCCEELGCFGGYCLPLLTVDGVERRRQATDAAGKQPGKEPWPRR
jgi:hypothetical protein